MKNISLKVVLLGSAVTMSACQPTDINTNVGVQGGDTHYINTKPEVSSSNSSEQATLGVAPKSVERNAVNPQVTPSVKLSEITKNEAPSLSEILNKKVSTNDEPVSEDDKLRFPAMKDTALTYGAQAGLAYASWQINKLLQQRSPQLDKIYNFQSLMTRGPDGVMVMPPVISEAKNLFEVTDEMGKSLRVADQAYEIITQARFVSTAPMWHTYLIREYVSPQEPPVLIMPKNATEKAYWDRHIREGWAAGEEQAKEIFQSDLNRLDRDYQGMVRYLALLSEGKVSDVVVAKGNLGITGDGQTMRVNDRTIRIMKDPELNLSTEKWSPTINTGPPATPIEMHKDKISSDFPRPIIRRY